MEQVPSASKEAAIGRWNQRPQVVAQQARIARMRTVLGTYGNYLSPEDAHELFEFIGTDDLSALKAHDDALWNEALTTGIEWQATRGHTLDADDYGNELRSLKR